MPKYSHTRAMMAFAIAGSVASLAAMPSAAAAKPLSKGAIIKLIKKYSKPGKQGAQGPKGDSGPAGSYTIGAGSGLTQTGNALSVDSGILGACPAHEFLSALSPLGSGSQSCGFPMILNLERGGLNSTTGDPDPQVGLNKTSYTTVASGATFGPVAPFYYVNAAIEVGANAAPATPDNIDCQLVDTTTSTVFQTVSQDVSGLSNLDLQDARNVAAGDILAVQCKVVTGAASGDAAQGTIAIFPVN
jgi:hypothetical protein